MFNFKWQEQAIFKQRVAVVAPRQAGKTYAAIQWARRAGKDVLYVASNRQMIPYIIQAFAELFPADQHAVRPSHGIISWNDGTVIHVIAGQDERVFRGYRADAVVIDDADYVPENTILNAVMCCTGERMYIGCTNPNRAGAKLLERFSSLELITIPGINGKNSSYKFLLESAY
jgi:hypothetical protein